MKFDYMPMVHWPPMAWVAECSPRNDCIRVRHGSDVETKNQWFCEAVWAGDFPAGDFDRTDIVAGSGARIRGEGIIFVASGSHLDRLHVLRRGDAISISNSLICLLVHTGADLDIAYTGYSRDFSDYRYTLFGDRTLSFPSTAGDIEMTYFSNLLWDGRSLVEHDKPCSDRRFDRFEDYRRFLEASIQLVAENSRHPDRHRIFKPVCSLSNGYDSPTIAALARNLEGVESFTFQKDRDGCDDSGESIAAALGIPCHVLDRDAWRNSTLPEVPFIACSGSVGDLAFKSAENILRGSVLFSGPTGDTVWGKNTSLAAGNALGGGSLLGLTEYRLWAGFFHCPVPLWGIRQLPEIMRLSNRGEMTPWDIGGGYNRPLCRRIVETAGVPRGMFGVGKRGMSVVPVTRRDFLTPASLDDMLTWLEERRDIYGENQLSLPNPALARLIDHGVGMAGKIIKVPRSLRYRRGFRSLLSPVVTLQKSLGRAYYHHNYTVHWAVDRAKRRYGTQA